MTDSPQSTQTFAGPAYTAPPNVDEDAPWKLPQELSEFIAAGDEAVIIEILDLFLQSLVKQVHDLAELQVAADPVRLGKLLHQLKGSSAQAGAERLRRLSAEAEALLRTSSSIRTLPQDSFDEIIIEAASVLEQVQTYRDSLAS